MYILGCRNALLKKIKIQSPPPFPPVSQRPVVREAKAPIPVDERTYLTEEGSGYFVLWDQRNYPASLPMARIDSGMARSILRNTPQGKKLLKDLYSRHLKQLDGQGNLNRQNGRTARNGRR